MSRFRPERGRKQRLTGTEKDTIRRLAKRPRIVESDFDLTMLRVAATLNLYPELAKQPRWAQPSQKRSLRINERMAYLRALLSRYRCFIERQTTAEVES